MAFFSRTCVSLAQALNGKGACIFLSITRAVESIRIHDLSCFLMNI